MLKISNTVAVPDNEIELTAVRAQGPGGQNVNKVSSAIHLRFDINASSLPDFYKKRLLHHNDQRITKDGVIIIKAQSYRTQDKNRQDALERLKELIIKASAVKRTRKPTKASRSSQQKRLEQKTRRGKTKALRKKVTEE